MTMKGGQWPCSPVRSLFWETVGKQAGRRADHSVRFLGDKENQSRRRVETVESTSQTIFLIIQCNDLSFRSRFELWDASLRLKLLDPSQSDTKPGFKTRFAWLTEPHLPNSQTIWNHQDMPAVLGSICHGVYQRSLDVIVQVLLYTVTLLFMSLKLHSLGIASQ